VTFEFVFMTDCQLGAYATFSGMDEHDVVRFQERDMKVGVAPVAEGFEWDAARYRAAIAAVNSIRPAFVVLGGDMVDDPESEAQYEAFMAITSDLDPDIPIHWAPGNHDIAADTVIPTRASMERYREVFGPNYYAFDHGDVRMIVLDTVVIDHPEHVPDEFEEQMEFLSSQIDRLVADGRRGIAFGHHPLFVDAPNEPDTYWNLPTDRRLRVLAEFRRGGVSHAFAGHRHRNSVARDGDFEMVTTGAVGYPLGDDPSGLRIVTVDGARIVHEYHALTEFEEELR
jgi:3',5'-cyclic AMP phosphodiesterase CpdA